MLREIRHRLFTSGTISRNTAILYGANILNVFTSLFFFSILARYLGPGDFGKFSFVYAFMTVAQSVGGFGLDILLVRETAADTGRAAAVTGEILPLKTGLSVFLVLFIVAGVRFLHLPPVTERAILVFAPYVIVSNVTLGLWYLGDGFQKMEFRGALTVAYYLTRMVAGWAILRFSGDIVLLFAGLLVLEVFFASVSFLLACRFFGRIRWVFNRARAVFLLRNAFPFAVNTILWIAFMRADILLLSFLKGETAVGLYSPAQKLLTAVLLLPQAFSGAVYPRMSFLYGRDTDGLLHLYRRSVNFLLITAAGICLCTVLAGPWLINLVFGARYAAAGRIMQVLIWVCPFYFTASIIWTLFSASGGQHLITAAYVCGAAAGLPAMYVLIQKAGYLGCAWGMVLLTALLLLFSWGIFYGQHGKMFSVRRP